MSIACLAEQFQFLVGHALGTVAEHIGNVLGTGCDSVSLSTFLLRAACVIRKPFNLTIVSPDVCAELAILDRILSLDPYGVRRIYTAHDCRLLAESNFDETEVAIVADSRNALHEKLLEIVSRDTAQVVPPGVVRIADSKLATIVAGPTLDLLVSADDRMLVGFGDAFSRFIAPGRRSQQALTEVLKRLRRCRGPRCHFAEEIQAALSASQKLLVTRLMATVASIRVSMAPNPARCDVTVTRDDYRITRELLTKLPVTGCHAGLSPHAAEYGAILFQAIDDDRYQLSLPDMSDFGSKAFTRQIAAEKLDVSYNTANGCIQQLEEHGIIESRVTSASGRFNRNRNHGRQIYFRFAEGKVPPFGVRSPFECLPPL